MELSDEQLQMLTRLGKAFFNYKQCAIQLQVDKAEFKKAFNDENSKIHEHYQRGFLSRLLELREADAENALRGSNPALQSLIRTAQDTNIENQT